MFTPTRFNGALFVFFVIIYRLRIIAWTLLFELVEERDRVAKSWVNEVLDVSLVVWEHLLVQLPAVERINEQLQCTF